MVVKYAVKNSVRRIKQTENLLKEQKMLLLRDVMAVQGNIYEVTNFFFSGVKFLLLTLEFHCVRGNFAATK